MGKLKKSLIIIITLMAVLFVGCKKNSEIVMKEFSSADRTVSIRMNESWNAEDMGVENWVAAFTEDETEGIVVMQMPKEAYSDSISNIEGLKGLVEQSFDVSGVEAMDKPEIAGLGGAEACKGTVNLETASGDGFIVYGETDYAYYSILYAAPRLDGEKTEYFRKVCATFKETAPMEEEAPEEAEASPEPEREAVAAGSGDVRQWFNAVCAVLIQDKGWDYNLYGGLEQNEANQALVSEYLVSYWEVTDRATADETLEMLRNEGHRFEFAEDMANLKELGMGELSVDQRKDFMIVNFTVSDSEAQSYVDWYTYNEENAENGIAAWDYSRIMTLLADYYLAGYYTEEEALDASLELAKTIQGSFDSWDSFMEGYFIGYEFWTFESSDGRRAIYDELKAAPDSPYHADWNLALEKDW